MYCLHAHTTTNVKDLSACRKGRKQIKGFFSTFITARTLPGQSIKYLKNWRFCHKGCKEITI
ncbi:hypothetical protein Mpsy_1958 [Methanolobus psychrophilus R15]|nr:hypothetical protein Mpsy_1958 [Methanolobus psychrophilus R15]